jgi:signal transduction histidine kinase/HAMP domain-containing protein
MRRMRGLSARLLIAIGVLVALHLAVFGTLLVTLDGVREADDEARDLARMTLATHEVHVALAELEAAERGVVVAGARSSFLPAWERAVEAVRARADVLARDGGPDARALVDRVRAYVDEDSTGLVTAVRERPLDARRQIAGGESARRVDAIERRLERIVVRDRAARQERRDRSSELAGIAQIVGLAGLIGILSCAVGLIAYLRRAIFRPLGGVADAARALAAGDLRARVPVHGGSGEVGELARTFDQMAVSLEESRTALERQNAELAEQSIELVEAVRSAREGASVLRAVLDATPDAIALLDRDGRVLVDNPPMGELQRELGADATAIDDRGALVPLDDRDVFAERRDDVTLLGTRRSFARYAAPVHDGRGRLIGRLLVLRETTAEREAEHAKEDFFALVSHELRTPLTAILGYVELVLGDDGEALPEEHARHLAVVERNAQRLLRLVGDLLFAAQIERGALLLEPGTVDLAQLVRDAVALARPRADEADIALTVETMPVDVSLGDRDRLAQVLDNLLSNALKFTSPGGRVAVRLLVRDARARLEVQDTGVGIPPEDVPKLFDRFYRATNARAGAVPGLGLGLMIVRAIVEGHDGTIAVDSEIGRGTTFVVELPLHPVDQAPQGTPDTTGYAPGGR